MKFLIALIMTISFTSAFAGGQTGSGMNGCWVKNEFGTTEWRSVEEIMYPEMIIKRPIGSRRYNSYNHLLYIPLERFVDMTENFYARRAISRLERVQRTHPKSHHIFTELFKLFRHVQVSNLKLSGVFKGELDSRHVVCKDFSPAVMTFKNGSIVVFKQVFEKLDILSAEILYVHETIRFAQTYHPAFVDLTDAELQKLTSLFFVNPKKSDDLNSLLNKYEDRLVAGNYRMGPFRTKLVGAEYNDPEKVFAAKFQTAVFFDEEFLGDELNSLRMRNPYFLEDTYSQTNKLLQSTNRQK